MMDKGCEHCQSFWTRPSPATRPVMIRRVETWQSTLLYCVNCDSHWVKEWGKMHPYIIPNDSAELFLAHSTSLT